MKNFKVSKNNLNCVNATHISLSLAGVIKPFHGKPFTAQLKADLRKAISRCLDSFDLGLGEDEIQKLLAMR